MDSFKRPSLEEGVLLPRRNKSHDVDKARGTRPTPNVQPNPEVLAQERLSPTKQGGIDATQPNDPHVSQPQANEPLLKTKNMHLKQTKSKRPHQNKEDSAPEYGRSHHDEQIEGAPEHGHEAQARTIESAAWYYYS